MMRQLIFISFLAILFLPTHAVADWLVYHKPVFDGQIIDGETKKPINGAVVVVLYYKRTIGLGAGTISSVINIRETVTDKEGRFHTPSYTTLIQPFSWEDTANFIIYKPGYVAVDDLYDRGLEGLFSGKMVGMQDQEFEWLFNKSSVFRYRSPNIVELPIAVSREERLRAIPPRDEEIREDASALMMLISKERSDLLGKRGEHE